MNGINTGFTWKDADGVRRNVFVNFSGSCFVLRESDGRIYRKYLPKPMSRRICSEIGMDYRSPVYLKPNSL